MSQEREAWSLGDAYESYVGRWSRPVARGFLAWLGMPPGRRWLDVGCGTGALAATVLTLASPAEVHGIDSSPVYVAYARDHTRDDRVAFEVGDAHSLPYSDGAFDAAVSGLVLNFLTAPDRVVAEMARVVRPGGVVALYVWDYADGMRLMRHFCVAAVALDPAARDLDEGRRFPLCRPEPLAELFRAASLDEVSTRALDVPTHFRDFDDYWSPFLGGQGPAPGYMTSLDERRRVALRERLRGTLPTDPDGAIRLAARAWAVRGPKTEPG
jgi:SAM-dependent methyltransferase